MDSQLIQSFTDNLPSARVFHCASFSSNLGDIFNHRGLYSTLKLDANEVVQIEIRNFYQNARSRFDKTFFKKFSNHDILIIGGGGFLDFGWSNSNTGCTLDFISGWPSILQCKALFVGLGYELIAPSLVGRAEKFLTQIVENNYFFEVRQDGSASRIKSDMGMEVAEGPDPSRRWLEKFKQKSLGWPRSQRVGVCLAADLILSNAEKESILHKLFQFIIRIAETRISIILLCQTLQDYKLWITVFNQLDARTFEKLRQQCSWASMDFDNPDAYVESVMSCSLVLSQRFHTATCCDVLGIELIPVRGRPKLDSFAGVCELETAIDQFFHRYYGP